MYLKVDAAREYRKKFGPEMPTHKLARILFKEQPLLFKNVEDARERLRYIEGKKGEFFRKKVGDKSLFMEGERPKNV
jgi:hypothetical protein